MSTERTRKAIRDFLQDAHFRFGGSISALAKAAGVAPSTISRPLNDPDFEFVPKMATLSKVANAAGMLLPAELRALEGSEGAIAAHAPVRAVPIVGIIWPGAWLEDDYEPRDDEFIYVPAGLASDSALTAFHVERSKDLEYPAGCKVVAATVDDESKLYRGDCVIVVRTDAQHRKEISLRELEIAATGAIELWERPRSEDADFENLKTYSKPGEMSVAIIGVVVASYREHRSGKGPALENWEFVGSSLDEIAP